MKTLYDTEMHFEEISLPYVRANHMEEDALIWYLVHYPSAAHEVMRSLIDNDRPVASAIARLYVTDTVDNPAIASGFAQSLGMTLGELDTMLDPATYREVSA
jgi:hypothetical protein